MRGTSKDKFCKGTNIPKHAGNFSAWHSSFNSREYEIRLENGRLMVGTTPLNEILHCDQVEWLMLNDPNFQRYEQKGTHTHVDGKVYTAERCIFKSPFAGKSWNVGSDWRMRVCVHTLGEFDYKFPEY